VSDEHEAKPGVPEAGPEVDELRESEPAKPVATGWFGRRRRGLIEWGSIIGIAVVAALLLRAFVIQPYFIPSGSMETTLLIGDKVLVNKLAYDFHPVHRGDVVVFNKLPNDDDPGVQVLIKRVIGLPGETISASGGQIYINGKYLPEPWLPKGTITANFSATPIPANCYFMMGDNRGDSADSRVFGCVPRSYIIGRAFVIVWPVSQIGTL
jgi:signal peptidase I